MNIKNDWLLFCVLLVMGVVVEFVMEWGLCCSLKVKTNEGVGLGFVDGNGA